MTETLPDGSEYCLGDWTVYPERACIERDGREVRLPPKAFAVLQVLVRSAGQAVSRQQLFEDVWPGGVVSDEALTQRISELRKALGDSAKRPRYIETIPKVGFRLIGPVRAPGAPDLAGADAVVRSAPRPDRPGVSKSTRIVLVAVLAVLALFAWRMGSEDRPTPPVAGTVTELPAAREMFLLAQNRMARRSSDGFDDAVEYLEQAVTLDPGYALAWVALAEVLLDRQAYFGGPRAATFAEARSAVDRALEVNGELGRAHAVLGRIHRRQGRLDEAEASYRKALALAPDDANLYRWHGDLLHDRGHLAASRSSYAQALERDPLLIPARMSLARQHEVQGEFDLALAQYHRVAEIESSDFQLLVAMGALEHGVFNRLDKAVSNYARSLSLEPGYAISYILLGLGYLDLESPGRAGVVFDLLYDNILREEPRQWFRILPAMYAGKRAEVLELARDFPREQRLHDTLYPLAVAQLRNQLLLEGHAEEAVALYRERFPRLFGAAGPEIGPGNYRAAIDLALALQANGEARAADRLLEAATTFIESRPRLGLGSGYGISDVQILALRGEPEAALAALENAVAVGWRSLWWYYLLQDPNLQSLHDRPAFQRAIRAIKLDVAAQMDRIYLLEREEESTADQYPGQNPF
jgi:DNA-binding winged helix-turn-helix (wHTH) protein/tetratricopeptide (TPR) repeat protein